MPRAQQVAQGAAQCNERPHPRLNAVESRASGRSVDKGLSHFFFVCATVNADAQIAIEHSK